MNGALKVLSSNSVATDDGRVLMILKAETDMVVLEMSRQAVAGIRRELETVERFLSLQAGRSHVPP